ncbi:hypothetical protein KDH_60260 [Dictyobacter sp. S3.2.2.5]|uniref:Tn3 transposase DDE domain-containing protein n=1 Tax=Dictyobacter halimunensis TaxID=3026934 RepID=A0ABQ6G3J6_9CHLR|nr:hypothetical protein KDH_60260 [Dictyobacter sp. S3.2.2.5]
MLSLDLTDTGFDASVLSEFRTRLVEHHAEELLLETMLTLFHQKGWLKARGRRRTDSTHVLAKIRALNRVLCVWKAMRAALNSLAVAAPDWLQAHSHPEWVERYGPRSEESNHERMLPFIHTNECMLITTYYSATMFGSHGEKHQ